MTTTLADPSVPPTPTPPARPRSRTEKIAVAVLLLVTAGLYLWNLDVSGWANAFYSGAVRAMTENWTAFFFGSTDAGNTVTVDKPPASLWVMALSARMFGLSSWSVLAPQALMGVGSVALLHATVRRVSGPVPALIGGFLFALTPVVVLMFRFNNPDALLVLLTLGAAYAVVRAIEGANKTSYNFGIPTAGPASTAGPGGIPGGAGGFPNGTPAGGESGPAGGPTGPAGRGGMGSSDAEVGRELSGLLQKAGTKWSAATINTSSSASLALASGTDVMGIGGFTGGDPAPTMTAFRKHGEIHYFVVTTTGPGGAGPGPTDPSQGEQRQTGPGGGTGMGMGNTGTASQIRTWVQQHYTAATIGGCMEYDLTRPAR